MSGVRVRVPATTAQIAGKIASALAGSPCEWRAVALDIDREGVVCSPIL